MSSSPAQGASAMLLLPIEDVRHVARTSSCPEETQAALWTIANRLHLDEDDVEILLSRIATTPEEQVGVLRTALWALTLEPERLPVERTIELATRARAETVRRAAIRALHVAPSVLAVEALRIASREDPVPANRGEAITFLATRLPEAEALEAAAEALRDETNPEVRARWLDLARAYGTKEPRAFPGSTGGSRTVPRSDPMTSIR